MGEGIVLVRRRALGDVVLVGSITAGGALPRPVTLVTEDRYVEVARRLRGVDEVLAFGADLPTGRIVDLQRDLATLRALPLRARRIRKASIARFLRVGLGLPVVRPDVPTLYGWTAGVAPVGPPWIASSGQARDGLALIPGASTPLKAWSVAGFAAVGRTWSGPVWVVGGPTDADRVAAVAGSLPGSRVCCSPGFAAAIDAFDACRVAVGGDSGLLHLAAACGAVPVGVFGPTHPDDGFFPYPRGRALGLALPCRPCARHRVDECRVGHRGCLGVDPPSVLAAVAEIVRASPR